MLHVNLLIYFHHIIEHFRAPLNNTLFLSEEHNYLLLENISEVCGCKKVKYVGSLRYNIQRNFVICTYHLVKGWTNFPKNLEATSKLCAPKGWYRASSVLRGPQIWGATVQNLIATATRDFCATDLVAYFYKQFQCVTRQNLYSIKEHQ